MESVQLTLLLLVFLVFVILMFLRKIPALLALPLLAFFIPLISGVNIVDIFTFVLGNGATRLSEAYTIAIFGSMLSIMMQKTGVAESFIKTGAELSGDKPWAISLVMLLLIILLFTTLGGLGAIIMVSTVVLPILASVGVGPVTTTGIFLTGLSIGGILNVGNWAVYTQVLKLQVDEVQSFALIMFVLMFVIAVVYITIQLYKDGHDINFMKIATYLIGIVAIGFLIWFGYGQIPVAVSGYLDKIFSYIPMILKYVVGAGIGLLVLLSLIRLFKNEEDGKVSFTAYFIPVIPLFLILVFGINFIAAFIAGLLYGFISTYRKASLNILIRSILDGGAVVMPAVALMLGIGMLLNAVMGPPAALMESFKEGWPVLLLLKPVLVAIKPESAMGYVILFSLAAPLALYRGPLNVWGMGYGIAAIFLAGGMPAGAIMGLLMAVGQIQGISDPTNTQNVWLANEMKIDVQKILWNTLPYTWIAAIIGLVVAAMIFY
ncbi:MAG: citrate transporter [Ignavibacteriaceae bacterium]|nr:citrate transporter [Ignavibacteriaceae bacterium]